MLKAAFFRCLRVPLNGLQILGDFLTVQIVESDFPFAYPGHFHVADVIDISGVFQDRRHIGSQIGFSVRHTQNHGAVFSGGINFLRVIFKHHRQGIRTADADHGMVDGIHRGALVFLIIIVNEFYSHFRVCLRVKGIALSQQLILQLLIILNNAVVNGDDISIVADMGMGVALRGFSMGCPTGMADAAGAANCHPSIGLFRQNLQSALCFDNLSSLLPVPHRETGRIIPSVLQFGKTIQKNGGRLMCACKANDSTHSFVSFSVCDGFERGNREMLSGVRSQSQSI